MKLAALMSLMNLAPAGAADKNSDYDWPAEPASTHKVSVEELRYQMDSGKYQEMMKRFKAAQKQKKIKQAEELDYDLRNRHRTKHDDVFRPR